MSKIEEDREALFRALKYGNANWIITHRPPSGPDVVLRADLHRRSGCAVDLMVQSLSDCFNYAITADVHEAWACDCRDYAAEIALNAEPRLGWVVQPLDDEAGDRTILVVATEVGGRTIYLRGQDEING